MGSACSFSSLSDEALSYMPLEAQMEHGNLQIAYFPGHISDPVITDSIVETCSSSWKRLLNGDSGPLRDKKSADPNFSPITAFYDVFYQHLFEKAPATRQFFNIGGIQKRAQSLIQMISTGLNMIGKDEAKIKKNLSFIAYSHGKIMGIGPKDYSPVVTALFYTLKELLGENWDQPTQHAWTVAYSYIVNIMVPIAVDSVKEFNKKKQEEIKDREKDGQQENSFRFHFNEEEFDGGGFNGINGGVGGGGGMDGSIDGVINNLNNNIGGDVDDGDVISGNVPNDQDENLIDNVSNINTNNNNINNINSTNNNGMNSNRISVNPSYPHQHLGLTQHMPSTPSINK